MGDRRTSRLGPAAFIPVACLFAIAYSAAAIIRHHNLNSRMLDLALQHQVVWNTSQGRWFESSLEVANYLGDHVSLNVLPVAVIYRLLPSVETLLVLQVLALTTSAVLLYFLARRVTRDDAAAFMCGLAFLLHPACGLQSINDFHLTVLGLPWVFGAILCAVCRRWGLASLLLVPALLAKEDVGLTLALFGIYAAIRWRARWFGTLWAVVGFAWPAVAMLVVLPHFRGGHSDTWRRYAWLASPDLATAAWVGICALHGALMLLVPLALVPLRSTVLLISSIVFGYCFTSYTAVWMANPAFQSLVPAIPFVFLALAHGVNGLSAGGVRHWKFVLGGCCLALAATEWLLEHMGIPTSRWLYVQVAVLCAGGAAAVLVGQRVRPSRAWIALPIASFVAYNPFTYVMLPFSGSIFRHHSPVRLADVQAANDLIPPHASVAASDALGPHFSARRILYQLAGAADCEYVVFSPRDDRERDPRVMKLLGDGLLADLGFVKCFERNTLQVWRKTSHFLTSDVPTYHTLAPLGADTDLGKALAEQGRLDEAIAYYEAGLVLLPEDTWLMLRLATVLTQAGRTEEAIRQYEAALAVSPNSASAHNNLANALRAVGRLDEAIAHYEAALRLRPRSAEVHSNLGVVYAKQQRTAEAVAAYREAIRLDPGLVAAHQNLIALLIAERRLGEAIDALRDGLSRSPNHPAMANQLAWLLATSPDAADRDGREAVAIAERLCEASGNNNPQALNTLAAAYAEAGRFADAVRTASIAHRLAVAQNKRQLAQSIARLLELYRAGRAYHQPP